MKTRFVSVVLASIAALLSEAMAQASEIASPQRSADRPILSELRLLRSPAIHLAQIDIATLATELTDYYRQRQPIPDLSSDLTVNPASALSLTNATQLRDQFVYQLTPDLGPIVGYKAGLTSPPAQARFGVDHPLRGVLLQDMLLESGATVPADFGARPLFEADLIVRVSDAAINHATTPEAALAALDAVIPFIELPDLMYAPEATLDAASLTAVNVGARLGVMGDPIAMDAAADWMTVLGAIRVDIIDGSGAVIADGDSQALMGHPLAVVLWLRDDLKQAGQCLRPGDLLSLGSITAPTPVQVGQTLRVRYRGLRPNQAVEVTVTFE